MMKVVKTPRARRSWSDARLIDCLGETVPLDWVDLLSFFGMVSPHNFQLCLIFVFNQTYLEKLVSNTDTDDIWLGDKIGWWAFGDLSQIGVFISSKKTSGCPIGVGWQEWWEICNKVAPLCFFWRDSKVSSPVQNLCPVSRKTAPFFSHLIPNWFSIWFLDSTILMNSFHLVAEQVFVEHLVAEQVFVEHLEYWDKIVLRLTANTFVGF